MPEATAAGRVRQGLIVLTLINLFNYLDRFVVPSLLESIKKSELHPSDTQLFSLVPAFTVVYMLAAPVFGPLGDRRARPPLIALGVLIWSVATALGGFARSYATLFLARATVGVGEAAYGTIAPSLLADYYPRQYRGRVFSIFFAAIPVGSALGIQLGGLVDAHFGWRRAFFIVGIPGLLLAALALTLRDPPRGAQDADGGGGGGGSQAPPRVGWSSYAALARNRPYVLTVLGYAAYTFALGGIVTVMPSFLQRIRGLPEIQATFRLGAATVATGLVATLVGGWLGDRLLSRTRQAYLWLSGLATLVAAPLALLALAAAAPAVYWTSIVAAELLLFASTGLINSAIINAVPPATRATAVAVSILAIHLFGDVPSPTIIGVISDASSLARAVLIIPVAVLVAGVIWTYAAWRGERAGGEPTP